MAKKSLKKNYKKVLAFDLGGTKICAAVIDEAGRVVEMQRELVDVSQGFKSLIAQFKRLGQPLIKKYKLKKGAIASAGPLDPVRGELINPTNITTNNKKWGVVPLIQEAEKALKIKLTLQNDAAAAMWAEHWVGVGQNTENLVIVTLGTGLGVGVLANGELVRSGRNLHPEAGHITLDYNDKEWLCGCGNYGCAEAYLSGKNFTKQMRQKLGNVKLTSERLVTLGRSGDDDVLREFALYGKRLAFFLYSLIVLFSPQTIILSGGFSHAEDLFMADCEQKLSVLLQSRTFDDLIMPDIKISAFRDEAGVIGAGYVAHYWKTK